jgi:hypothetical protein
MPKLGETLFGNSFQIGYGGNFALKSKVENNFLFDTFSTLFFLKEKVQIVR